MREDCISVMMAHKLSISKPQQQKKKALTPPSNLNLEGGTSETTRRIFIYSLNIGKKTSTAHFQGELVCLCSCDPVKAFDQVTEISISLDCRSS